MTDTHSVLNRLSNMIHYPRANLITGILVLLGTHPLHEKRKPKWHQKIHFIGLLFCVLQFVLTIYTFLLEQQSGAFGSTHDNKNNILYGSVVVKKLFALLLPLGTILLKFCTIRELEKFFERMQLFDVFLQSTGHQTELGGVFESLQQEMELKTRKVNFSAGVFILLVEIFSLVTALAYMRDVRGFYPSFFTLYFYHSAISIFLATSLNLYTKLYGVMLRHELFNAFVQELWAREWQEERFKRMQRRTILRQLVRGEQ